MIRCDSEVGRLLRHPDIPSGHSVVSSFCVFSIQDCNALALAQNTAELLLVIRSFQLAHGTELPHLDTGFSCAHFAVRRIAQSCKFSNKQFFFFFLLSREVPLEASSFFSVFFFSNFLNLSISPQRVCKVHLAILKVAIKEEMANRKKTKK